jgi:hypothetical protein
MKYGLFASEKRFAASISCLREAGILSLPETSCCNQLELMIDCGPKSMMFRPLRGW